mmetsp:Transcript_40262/g.78728  ORF Transcript_40262/g.78728 Transcript_40262/m.78728 type:complete len:102 (+) Transcript_40262:107-412(+)
MSFPFLSKVIVIKKLLIALTLFLSVKTISKNTKVDAWLTQEKPRLVDEMVNGKNLPEPVGDFFVHLVRGVVMDSIDTGLTSNYKLLARTGKPTVIHFYDGG